MLCIAQLDLPPFFLARICACFLLRFFLCRFFLFLFCRLWCAVAAVFSQIIIQRLDQVLIIVGTLISRILDILRILFECIQALE